MKKTLLLVFMVFISTFIFAQGAEAQNTGNFIKDNWIQLLLGLLGFIKIIVNLTPTEKDNKIFNWIENIIEYFIPNIKKGGGAHTKNIYGINPKPNDFEPPPPHP